MISGPSTNLLSSRFHLGLFGLSGFLDVLRCQSGNHCVMDRPALIVDPVGPVEKASTLSRPARPCRSSTRRWRNTYMIQRGGNTKSQNTTRTLEDYIVELSFHLCFKGF